MNELVRQIVADELERLDDADLELVTVTHVTVDPDLRHATVSYSSLVHGEEEAREALERHRPRLQAAIARQARLKRTPELHFSKDETIERTARIERILREERGRRA